MKTGVEPDPDSTSDGPGTTDLDGDSLFQISSCLREPTAWAPGHQETAISEMGLIARAD